jgi:hypothetical protein
MDLKDKWPKILSSTQIYEYYQVFNTMLDNALGILYQNPFQANSAKM